MPNILHFLGHGGQDNGVPVLRLADTDDGDESWLPVELLHTNHHRMLLQRLFARGIPRGTLAVVDPDDTERVLWEKGSGLPGKGEGVEVMESSIEDLGDALQEAEGDS